MQAHTLNREGCETAPGEVYMCAARNMGGILAKVSNLRLQVAMGGCESVMHRQETRDGAMAWRWTGPVGFNGDPPEPRCSHSCTLVDDDLFIIGGGRIVGESRPLAFVQSTKQYYCHK